MVPLRCRGAKHASAASRFSRRPQKAPGSQKRHRLLPAAVPLLVCFLVCLLGVPFFPRPVAAAYAQDRAAVTRVREYFPQTDSLPEAEIYYPQLSFGGNPNELQTANTMMREYAIRMCHTRRQAAQQGRQNLPADGKLVDYRVVRNSGGFFSVVFTEGSSLAPSPTGSPGENAAFPAEENPRGFTVRLSDQKVCRLADLFLSHTNYTSLLDQEISRQLQSPFEGVRHDSPFFLTDDSIVLLPDTRVERWPQEGPLAVSLTAPAVSRKLAAGLSVGRTRAEL